MTTMATRTSPDESNEAQSGVKPFAGLLAPSSFAFAVLVVAGFSLRWSYYYNFGLQSIVLQAPIASLPVSAIEILRSPEHIGVLVWLAVKFLVPFQAVLFAVRAARRSSRKRIARAVALVDGALMTDSPLVVETIRVCLIVYVAFAAGNEAGTGDYFHNVVETTSKLPRVTAVLQRGGSDIGKTGNILPIVCDTRPPLERTSTSDPPFIGAPEAIQLLRGGDACSSAERSWRLLYRDDKFIYLFLTVPTELGIRPPTLILPNSDNLTLIIQ